MNYYNEIKQELINNEICKKVKNYTINKSDLNTYFNVGKLLVEAQGGEKRAKYGDGLIKEYSSKLMTELGSGYTISALKRMRHFYNIIQKGVTLSHQLSWSHYVEMLKFDDINEINYYIRITIECNLSIRELRLKIKSDEYERLDTNTKNKLINDEKLVVSDFIKNPILIKNNLDHNVISEKILKKLILENIDDFLKELGNGFCYIENEYKIKLAYKYNYIDLLLLFNYIYNCFVVIELKVTELRKEYIGQIQTYMNYIDKNVKNEFQQKTIGIIICKKNNQFIVEYCSDDRIVSREYIFI